MAKRGRHELVPTKLTTRQAMEDIHDKALDGFFVGPFYSLVSFLPVLKQHYQIECTRENIKNNFLDLANEVIELYDEYIQTNINEQSNNAFRVWEARNRFRQNAKLSNLQQKLNKLENQQSNNQSTITIEITDDATQRRTGTDNEDKN